MKLTFTKFGCLTSALIGCLMQPADSMTFELHQTGDKYFIEVNGQIVQGDRVKLVTAIDAVPLSGTLIGLIINSPGGDIFEAERLASTIRSSGLTIGVGSNKVCASACFLLFASATKKFTLQSSHVGVHSASEAGTETLGSMGFTTALARDAASYGVPDTILGHMVATQPGAMFWLTESDILSMGARIFPDDGQDRPASVTTQPISSQPRSTLSAVAPPDEIDPSEATLPGDKNNNRDISTANGEATVSIPTPFQQGLADRTAVEDWFKTLSPEANAGATHWASQRSLKKPGSCTEPSEAAPTRPAAWAIGCVEAQKMFALPDRRRRSEPDYKAGWNSFDRAFPFQK